MSEGIEKSAIQLVTFLLMVLVGWTSQRASFSASAVGP